MDGSKRGYANLCSRRQSSPTIHGRLGILRGSFRLVGACDTMRRAGRVTRCRDEFRIPAISRSASHISYSLQHAGISGHSSAHSQNVCVFVIYIINLDPTKYIHCVNIPENQFDVELSFDRFPRFHFFPPFDSFNFRVLARARLIFGNDERGCGGSSTLRIRPWDRIPPYRKGQRNGRMRQTCLEVDLGSWDPRGTSPKGVSSTSRCSRRVIAYLVWGIPYLMPTPTRGRALIIFFTVAWSENANRIEAVDKKALKHEL